MEKKTFQSSKLSSNTRIAMHRFFYWPFAYTDRAKLSKRGRLLSYFGILVFPPVYFALVLQAPSISLINTFLCLLGVVLIQNLYEIGYIQNDTETIKKEANPTMRLNSTELEYYASKRISIYGTRIGIDLLLSALLVILGQSTSTVWVFLGVAHLITPFFLLYNYIRNKWNLLLHFLLSILKFSSLQFLFSDTMQEKVLILSIFAYPLINMFDRMATPRFNKALSAFYIPRTAQIRATYYLMLFITCLVAWAVGFYDIRCIFIIGYFFVYRSMIVLLSVK